MSEYFNKNVSNTFEWQKLDATWERLLASENFRVKNCKGDGNCQFRSLETAFVEAGYKISHTNLRQIIGEYVQIIPQNEFDMILMNYRIEYKNDNFQGQWDPFSVHTKEEFIREITKPGFSFQGDDVTLSLFSRALAIDFIILDDQYNIINLSNDDNLNAKIIILFRNVGRNSGHYQTIGLNANEKILTIFDRNDVPEEVNALLNKIEFFKYHMVKVPLTSQTKLINYFTQLFERNLTNTEKGILQQILNQNQNNNYKHIVAYANHTNIINTKHTGNENYYSPPNHSTNNKSTHETQSRKPTKATNSTRNTEETNYTKSSNHKTDKSKQSEQKQQKTVSKRKSPKTTSKRKSPKQKSKRKSPKTKSKRKSPKTKSKRKSPKQKSKRKSPKQKSKRKSPKTKSKRKSPKTKSKRKSPKQKSKRKSPKQKSKRKSPKQKSKRKSPKQKSKRKSPKTKSKRKSPKTKSKRKSPKQKSKRKSPKTKSKRKSPKQKSKRKSPKTKSKLKSVKRKSAKRKSPKQKSKRKTRRSPKRSPR